MSLSDELRRVAVRQRDIRAWTIENWQTQLGNLSIKTKQNTVEKLILKPVQVDILTRYYSLPRDRKKQILVLKARQMGVSTLVQGMCYSMTRALQMAKVTTVSHEADATARLHKMQNFFLERDIPKPQVKHNRIGALEYKDMESEHYIGTAGQHSFGRGDTINMAHVSELAFWKDAKTLITGLVEALTPDGTIFYESTPNGVGGYFYELWQGAPENGCLALFYPWWWDESYRLPLDMQFMDTPLSDEEKELMEKHILDFEQIAWRRDKYKTLREMFYQEYPEDAISCFLSSGTPYFDSMTLKAIESTTISEPIEYEPSTGLSTWIPPVANDLYVISADPAEGMEGGDFSVAEVWNARTGEQCAEIRGHWPIEHFARICCNVATKYNGALLAPERNNHGHAFISHSLNVLKYDHMYMHEEYNVRMGERSKKYGWPTTTTSKPVMLSDFSAGLMDGSVKIHSAKLLSELRTMHWNGKGGVEAIEGTHDDTVIAACIANQARKQPQHFLRAMDYFDIQKENQENKDNIIELTA